VAAPAEVLAQRQQRERNDERGERDHRGDRGANSTGEAEPGRERVGIEAAGPAPPDGDVSGERHDHPVRPGAEDDPRPDPADAPAGTAQGARGHEPGDEHREHGAQPAEVERGLPQGARLVDTAHVDAFGDGDRAGTGEERELQGEEDDDLAPCGGGRVLALSSSGGGCHAGHGAQRRWCGTGVPLVATGPARASAPGRA
jgi:hypothetical protein